MLSQYAFLLLPLALAVHPPADPVDPAGEEITTIEINDFYPLTPEHVKAYRNGTPPSEIVLATGETLKALLAEPQYEITWASVSSGGGLSTQPTGTRATPDCGGFEVYGISGFSTTGYSQSATEGYEVTLGILTTIGLIFADGFESESPACWSTTQP